MAFIDDFEFIHTCFLHKTPFLAHETIVAELLSKKTRLPTLKARRPRMLTHAILSTSTIPASSKPPFFCKYCHEPGHFDADCHLRKHNNLKCNNQSWNNQFHRKSNPFKN